MPTSENAAARPVVLVTGASAGIGAATARLAAGAGWDVGVNYRSDRAGAEAAAEAVRAAGGRALLLQADVADPAQVAAMFDRLDEGLGRLDALVNNAGIVAPAARVEQITAERLSQLFAVNVTGSFLCAAQAVRRLSRAHGGPGGAIVNVSSVAAVLGGANQYVDYAATKGAIDSFTIGLAAEQAAHGLRVNAVRPGVIETPIHAKGGAPDRAARMAPDLPMRRAGTADEVAEAILWLLSDKASYVTGEILKVSGGR
ncbi:SDR family oxidoreductase [Rhodobacteraceae bacterium 2CG4]|uniref:SDR family oxidoreductase n=1 Tax=Halovulum marinum TaxID=2662447 RepID=A0A6L5Z205_9RHOB|nr:SDR family oxidoreductase [Halovulum marinum]MSU90538.1 SDR family oxidoreductase [Halovulum marinum]